MKAGLWSASETFYLRTHYSGSPVTEISAHLKRKVGAVRWKAHHLGLKKKRDWMPSEDALLRRLVGSLTYSEISQQLSDRTPRAVKRRAWKLGLAGELRIWTEAEVTYLETHYQEMTAGEIATVLDMDERQVWNKASALGLRKREPFTPEAEAVLWEMRNDPGCVPFFSAEFGVGEPAVRLRLQELEAQGGPTRMIGNLPLPD